jgi:5-methylcytosine-specific restriction enzyme A
VKATDVDHKDPHNGDLDKFWDTNNFRVLCHSCHSTVTGLARKYNFGRDE